MDCPRFVFRLWLLLIGLYGGCAWASSIPLDSAKRLYNRADRLLERGQLDSALEVLHRIPVRFASNDTTSPFYSDVFRKKSIIYRKKSLLDSAFRNARIAIQRAEESRQLPYYNAVLSLAMVHERASRFDSAIYYYMQILSALDPENHRFDETIGSAYLHVINVFYRTQDDKRLYRYLQKAQDLAQKTHDRTFKLYLSERTGAYFLQKGNFEKALESFRKITTYPGIDTLGFDVASAFANMAAVHSRANRYDSALYYNAKALARTSLPGDSTRIYENMGANYAHWAFEEDMEPYRDSALRMYHYALKRCRDEGNIFTEDHITYKLYRFYDHIDQADSALHYYRVSTALHDSIFRLNRKKAITEIEQKYQNEKLRAENLETSLALEQESLRSEQRRRNLWLLSALALIGLVTGGSGFYAYRQRTARLLSEKQRELDHQKKALEDSIRKQETKALDALMEGQDQERRRIAEDLHDRLGGLLSTVRLYYNRSNERLDAAMDQTQQLKSRVATLLDQAIQEVRRVSHDLASGTLDQFGLEAAVRELRDSIQETGQMNVVLYTEGLESGLHKSYEVMIYRMVQELITNAIRHADATQIVVQLYRDEDGLSISVEDNGKGFDPTLLKEKTDGMGLQNVRNRTERLKGHFEVDAQNGMGASIQIWIPLGPS